jgi:hypothetical protein
MGHISTGLDMMPRRVLDADRQDTDRQQRATAKLPSDFLGFSGAGARCSWAVRTGGRQRCGKWSCDACRLFNGRDVAHDVLRGLEEAERSGMAAVFITITDGSGEPMPAAEFNRRFSRLVSGLRRSRTGLEHYIAALDCDPLSGRLHRHVVAICQEPLSGRVIADRARGVGLGHTKVQRIGSAAADRARIANYLARNGVRYAALCAASGRVQPFTRSRERVPSERPSSSH